jgi:hypothetical protein
MTELDDIFREEVERLKTDDPISVDASRKVWHHYIKCTCWNNEYTGWDNERKFIFRHLSRMPWIEFKDVTDTEVSIETIVISYSDGSQFKAYDITETDAPEKDGPEEDDCVTMISDSISIVFDFRGKPTYMQWKAIVDMADEFADSMQRSMFIDFSSSFHKGNPNEISHFIYYKLRAENIEYDDERNGHTAHINREIDICGYEKYAERIVYSHSFVKCRWRRSKAIFKDVTIDNDSSYDTTVWKFSIDDLRKTGKADSYKQIFDSYEKKHPSVKIKSSPVLSSEFLDSDRYTGFVIKVATQSPGERLWLTYMTEKTGAWSSRMSYAIERTFSKDSLTIRKRINEFRKSKGNGRIG